VWSYGALMLIRLHAEELFKKKYELRHILHEKNIPICCM